MKLSIEEEKGPKRAAYALRLSGHGIKTMKQSIKKGLTASTIGAGEDEEEAAKEKMTFAEKKEFMKLSSRKRRQLLWKQKPSALNYRKAERVPLQPGKTSAAAVPAAASAKAARKTVRKFRESLEASMAGEAQAAQKLREAAGSRIAEGKSSSGMQKGILLASGVAMMAAAQAAAFGSMLVSMVLAVLLSVLPFAAILSLAAVIIVTLFAGLLEEGHGHGGSRIVQVARQEYEAADENTGGQKYKAWYGMDADWCAIFVSWCADQCDYIEEGIMPKTASVASMREWYSRKGLYHPKEGYEPKEGDLIFFENGMSHVGIVVSYDKEVKTVTTIEGNSGHSSASPYHAGSRVTQNTYSVAYSGTSGYASPEYPDAEVIEIPEPYGTVYSYMGWQTITSPTSLQYKLREEAGQKFDGDGFAKIGDRYVIACTTTFGKVGDFIDWELENGTVIHTVIGDTKNQNDAGCNEWGHLDGACVVEFVVDKNSWYGTGRYPADYHPDWSSRAVRAVKTGSYW